MKDIIKKILKEESLKQSLMDEIKHSNFQETAKMIGGMDNLIKLLNIESPMDFLHLFDDLNVVQSEEDPDWILFRYKPKYNLMIYERRTDRVFISYIDIWLVLKDHFGLKHTEIQELTKTWLDEVYNLRVVSTHHSLLSNNIGTMRFTI